ncbi:HD-GYP domain-containing protein [Radiobacillus kanasensis]|uniref:HD-GYP domain-containing protein n=1 Tax=Radiobacillus kanasensis TaxID=2844358 RepID=UPI001E2F55A1|nr:HD-GYP domain-containing protein [Radiobacillus kanasensis]UFT98431.1 HD-GYP domain-containing protein [Radiobacillus kanasensis]
MIRFFNKLLTYPAYFRYGFYLLVPLSILIHLLSGEAANNYYILYIVSTIFLGIGFYNRSVWFVFAGTLFLVTCRSFLETDHSLNIWTYFTYFFTYLMIAFISVALMQNAQKIREDSLELTKALVNTLESRDAYTLHHSEKVAELSKEIATKMRLPKRIIRSIYIGGLLHDIGKIGIPEHILNKPTRLTEDEYSLIKEHSVLGYNIIKHITSFQESGVLDVVLYHHERYDGTGYPEGIKKDKIPLSARIVSVADSFDAMSSDRVYRDKYSLTAILEEIQFNNGTQFDPEVVGVFLSLFDEDGTIP